MNHTLSRFNPLAVILQFFVFCGLFGLGFNLFGGNKSESKQQTTTTTTNANFQGVEGNALNFGSSSGNTVNLSDGGAIAEAFTFASRASRDALDFAYNAGAPDAAISRNQLYVAGGVLTLLGLAWLSKRKGKQ